MVLLQNLFKSNVKCGQKINSMERIMLSTKAKNAAQQIIQQYLDLDEKELELLISHNKFMNFSPGEIILQQGKRNVGMYIILKGTALVTGKILGEGGTYISTLGPGNLLGEISLIEKRECPASAIASSPVECLLISNEYFAVLSLLFPETKYKILTAITKEVTGRLKDMHKKITSYISHSDMTAGSMFGEVIKSLTKPTTITSSEADYDLKELRQAQLFEEFTNEEFDELMQHTSLIKAPKQCTLVQEGEKKSSCYILLRGAVQSSIVQDNKTAKLSVLGPLSFLSSISSIDETSAAIINFTTCEHAILLKISEAALTYFRKNNSNLWYKLFDLICQSLVSLERAADKLDIRLNSELYNR